MSPRWTRPTLLAKPRASKVRLSTPFHNRFEHSLGVAHLSAAFVDRLYANARDPYARRQYDNPRHYRHARTLVQLAGLCHDLGHGPYSHLFDHVFLPAVPGMAAHPMRLHEARSAMMFRHLVDAHAVDLQPPDVRHVADLIAGRGREGAPSLRPAFLYDIVANAKNGIDTDKFDYLARDVYSLGLQTAYGFDHQRLISFAKVVRDDVCFHRKELFNVHNLFLTRFQLHRTFPPTPFVPALRRIHFADSPHAPFHPQVRYTTTVPHSASPPWLPTPFSRQTARSPSRPPSPTQSPSCASLTPSSRDLYRFVDEILLPPGRVCTVAPQDITTCQDLSTGVNLVPEDVYVVHVPLHFGMKSKNPVDNVLFFKDWEDQSPEHLSTAKASYVLPVTFEENILRVFVKRERGEADALIKRAVTVAFRNFVRRSGLDPSPASEMSRKNNHPHTPGHFPTIKPRLRPPPPPPPAVLPALSPGLCRVGCLCVIAAAPHSCSVFAGPPCARRGGTRASSGLCRRQHGLARARIEA
ncbi:unnamed protein product [Chondrus crispus]|uniref:HD domain-containing protein n=1 Tax=Chondrus crispus TaxID=2769 RepID=R7QI31_CHOCR|nr:unnamed protein product [Chondrus crispus]CDF37418.1 unnamed protein product [Chondrus crispus]|eukprot:XP_005717237.1 unnamed protein product [Chondrus crispus]